MVQPQTLKVIMMKLTNQLWISILAVFLFLPGTVSAKGGGNGVSRQTVTSMLTPAEKDTLLWMREEEKLARDVYLTMNQKWQTVVFSNIADSEQNHMNAIKKKLDQFNLDDPVLPGIGHFSNADLQTLYDQLITQGSASFIDALWVGATIEDMDIVDLQEAIANTDKLSLQVTYQNLLEGSKNHLRAFVGQLQNQGVDYQSQYLDQELFEAILGF